LNVPGRSFVYAITVRTTIALLLLTGTAAADVPAFKLHEDAVLGVAADPKTRVLSDKHEAALAACASQAAVNAMKEPSSGAVFYVEISKANRATTVKVRGTGKPTLDTCLEGALAKATAATKPAATVGIAGRIDVKQPDKDAYWPSARTSSTAVLLPSHEAKWQLTVHALGYTANRALDFAAELSAVSADLAACAPKRGARAAPAEGIAWTDGAVLFRSGTPAYDACVGKAIGKIKLPTAASAAWFKIAITAPAEPLAPRNTNKPGLDRSSALKDALTTAVRSRKEQLLTCLDVHPKANITKVVVALAGGKVRIVRGQTGDPAGDVCVRKQFGEVAIPAAKPDDTLELEVELSPQQ
jgi:hypothetical protein